MAPAIVGLALGGLHRRCVPGGTAHTAGQSQGFSASEGVSGERRARASMGGFFMRVDAQVRDDLLEANVVAGSRRWLRRYVLSLVGLDAFAAVLAAVTAFLVRFTDHAGSYLAFS